MPYPNLPEKRDSPAIITPERAIHYLKQQGSYDFDPPRRVILTYSYTLFKQIMQNFTHSSPPGRRKILLLDKYPVAVVGNIGIGGPMTATMVEELGVLGAKEFIIVGTAGAISPSLDIGQVALIDRAIRDEGVSHHYLPPAKWVAGSADLLNIVEQAVNSAEIDYQIGSSWTTDAPYRETEVELRTYQQEGVLAVEMETATVFAICQYRNYQATALLIISDSLANLEWNPQFHDRQMSTTLYQLAKIAITAGIDE